MTYCAHCSLPIPSMSSDVPRCRKCKVALCPPSQRDCGLGHWRAKHATPAEVKQ